MAGASILMIDPWSELLGSLRRSAVLQAHEIEAAAGNVHALRLLRGRHFDVVITSPTTTVDEDLELLVEIGHVRPGVRPIVLAARAAPDSVIAALRSRVFSLFTAPFVPEEIAAMAARASTDRSIGDGIDVVSARPWWVEVRVNCSLVNAERLIQFLGELRAEVPGADREGLLVAFREVLLNAMEHGAALDPESLVEVAAVRTDRAIVFYVKDPGRGFAPSTTSAPEPGESEGALVRRAERDERARGFGLLLARTIVDELIYSEHANEVLLIKHTK